MITFFAFILGLIIGSFLNAVIFRLYKEESFVADRSRCPHCRHELSAADLIPVLSFVMLGGRCRYCKKRISWQYPLVELATASIFVLLALNFQFPISSAQFWYQVTIASFLILIAVFDFKHYLILDKVVYPATAIVILWNLFSGEGIGGGLLSGIIISGFFAFQYFVSDGRWIGFGDVKFGFLLGNIFGIKLGIVMLVISYFIGAIVGLTLIFLKKKNLGSKLPFGVFLSISAIIMMLYGKQITDWYFRLIGL